MSKNDKTGTNQTATRSGAADAKATPKLSQRVKAKLPSRHKQPVSLRITNDNIEQHREDILAKGRKLKYPIQYSKKRLIIISLIVIVAAVTIFGLWLNNALYRQQQTGDFFYSVTKILPLNVASVDGQPVRYQDYLRRLRADIYYYLNREHRSFNSDEGREELDYHKRKNLDVAEKAAYVEYLAEQNNVSVSRETIDEQIKQMREADGATEEDLISTLSSYYGWTLGDFRMTIHDQLLEQAVSYAIDDEAKSAIESAQKRLKAGEDFATVAQAVSDDESSKKNGGVVVAKTSDQDPTGIVDAVSKLSVGQTTDIQQVQIDNANYYYIARLNAKNDDEINYSIIMIKLDKLDNQFNQLRKDDKIKEYISVPAADSFGGGE